MTSAPIDFTSLALRGGELTASDRKALEQRLRAHPDDAEGRARLIGYYAQGTQRGRQARRRPHALWFIEHRPAEPFTGSPFVILHEWEDAQGHAAAERLWLKHARVTRKAQVLSNAAHFFFDRQNAAERLLRRALRLQPNNPDWPAQLGRLFSIKSRGVKGKARVRQALVALKYFERQQRLTRGRLARWYGLNDIAQMSFNAGRFQHSARTAKKMVRLASEFPDDWNHGNALHHGNVILGRISLLKGRVKAASRHLLKAGDTPGSPQLGSFGPSLELARELLREGERDTVVDYLGRCKRFWSMSNGDLDRWAKEIRKTGHSEFQRRH